MDDMELDELEELLATPDPARRTRKPKVDDRTITGWFKLLHTSQRDCEVPSHDEQERPRSKGMTAIISDVSVCRVCFLAEKDKT